MLLMVLLLMMMADVTDADDYDTDDGTDDDDNDDDYDDDNADDATLTSSSSLRELRLSILKYPLAAVASCSVVHAVSSAWLHHLST